jgi:UDP-4-amino-4,6-dideoxy-N-acetyl-beta-L-idosamine acetyltransferase
LSNKDIFIIGFGGHYKVIQDALDDNKKYVKGVISLDPQPQSDQNKKSFLYYSDTDFRQNIKPENVMLVNAIGFTPKKSIRKQLFLEYKELGYKFLTIASSSSVISSLSKLEEGTQILFRSSVMADSFIGANTIINNAAHIDHDCHIGAHNHIAPGAILCGSVVTGENVFIGAGSIILPNLDIGNNTLVQAGAVVSINVPADSTIFRNGKIKKNK